MDDNKNLIEKIKELLERLKAAIRKRAQERRDGKLTPAVFEKQLKEVERRLEEFDEQDAIHSDCLRDVAETLEKITGRIENGDLRNAAPEEIQANMDVVVNKTRAMKERGSLPFTVSSQTLDDVLEKAFGKKAEDFYITAEDGTKLLSPNVKFAFDKKDGKPADVYMIVDDSVKPAVAVKVKVDKKDALEKIIFDKVPVTCNFQKYSLKGESSDHSLELMPLDKSTDGTLLREKRLEEIIGQALFESSLEYMEARREKGVGMAEEWKSISGTRDNPYESEDFQCFNDKELGYCIKDRTNKTMIAFKYDKSEKSLTANYFTNVVNGFDVDPAEHETVMKIQKDVQKNGQSNLVYSILTSPNADRILDTKMAQKALGMILPNSSALNALNAARNTEGTRTGGELVKGANRDKIIMLRNEIETQLRSKKGLDGYYVAFQSARHGKETQLVISAPDKAGKSEYTINFDKSGNIKSHLWSSVDIATGKRGKPMPVLKSEKNFINKVLNKEAFSKNELCVCYQAVKESLKAVDDKLREQGFSFSQNMDAEKPLDRTILENSLLEQWAELAKEAVIDKKLSGKLDNSNELVYMILNQAEMRDGVYPDAEYKEALTKNVEALYYALSEKGVIEDVFSKKIAPEYAAQREEAIQRFEAVGYASNEARDEAAQEYADMAQTFSDDELSDEVISNMLRDFHEIEDQRLAEEKGGWNCFVRSLGIEDPNIEYIPEDEVPEEYRDAPDYEMQDYPEPDYYDDVPYIDEPPYEPPYPSEPPAPEVGKEVKPKADKPKQQDIEK